MIRGEQAGRQADCLRRSLTRKTGRPLLAVLVLLLFILSFRADIVRVGVPDERQEAEECLARIESASTKCPVNDSVPTVSARKTRLGSVPTKSEAKLQSCQSTGRSTKIKTLTNDDTYYVGQYISNLLSLIKGLQCKGTYQKTVVHRASSISTM